MKKIKIFILSIIVITLMILIYKFSNQDFKQSLSLSEKVINVIQGNFGFKNINISTMQIIVRKIAHFTLYFILGFIVFLILKNFVKSDKKLIKWSIIICFIYACTDEIHQLFVPGRTGSIIDVLIDVVGSICGIFIIRALNNLFKKN